MKKSTIEKQEVVNHLEALGYEAAARKELLSHMAQAGVLPGDPAFQAYHKEYEECFARYELAKAGLERQYVQPLAPEGVRLSWRLDYSTRELTVQGVD